MMIRVSLPEATIRRVASTPSSSGMRTSISATSGRSACGLGDRLEAVGRLAGDVQVGLTLDHHPETHPHQLLIIDQ